MWGFQLWVNLPAKDKMTAPRYQDIPPDAIPTEALPNGGAGRVSALDVDLKALQVTAENARANKVDLDVCAPELLPPGDYDVVVANILSNPLILLAPLICSLTRGGGRLALSGILETQAADVIAAYAPAVELSPGGRAGGWILLEGKRQ